MMKVCSPLNCGFKADGAMAADTADSSRKNGCVLLLGGAEAFFKKNANDPFS